MVIKLLLTLIFWSGSASLVLAQSKFSEEKITNYARAAHAIEQKRTEILQRATSSPDWAVVSQKANARGLNICDLAKEEQTGAIQSLCRELFIFAEQERRRNGFDTNSEFNHMTRALQQDRTLQERVRRRLAEQGAGR